MRRLLCGQVCYSLLDLRASEDMTQVCQEYGVKLLVYGVLAGGLLSKVCGVVVASRAWRVS